VRVDGLSALELGTDLASGIEVSSINMGVGAPVVLLVTVSEDCGVSDVWLSMGKVAGRWSECLPAVERN
jgi:hypothetical protein